MFRSSKSGGTVSPAGSATSWRVDETYVKIKGKWTYLYRAVDKQGRRWIFCSAPSGMLQPPKRFFPAGVQEPGPAVTKDHARRLSGFASGGAKSLANISAGSELKFESSKYLNNLIKQDHRSTKFRLGPMLGMKRFRSASITIAGIEIMHRIRKEKN